MSSWSCIASSPIVLAIALVACDPPAPRREWTPDDHGQPQRVDPERVPSGAERAEDEEDPAVRAARALWNAVCAGCHGREGRGDGPSRPPGATLADFADPAWQSARSDVEIAAVIREGRNMMPAFGEQLRGEGIEVLVAYVRSLGTKEASAPAPTAPPPPTGEADPPH